MQRFVYLILSWALIMTSVGSGAQATAGEVEFEKIQGCFRNFFQCEMTRKDGVGYFDKKPFEIVSTHVSDVRKEGNTLVVTGTIVCWVDKANKTLFAAIGVNTILGHEQVAYMDVRNQDFSILASELAGFPCRPGCPWLQHWINEN